MAGLRESAAGSENPDGLASVFPAKMTGHALDDLAASAASDVDPSLMKLVVKGDLASRLANLKLNLTAS